MTISLMLSKEDARLIKKYASRKCISVSDYIRQAVLDRIESENDTELFDEAYENLKKNPTTYTLNEIEKEFVTF